MSLTHMRPVTNLTIHDRADVLCHSLTHTHSRLARRPASGGIALPKRLAFCRHVHATFPCLRILCGYRTPQFGETPLHVAAGKGQFEAVRMLLRCGAAVDAKDRVRRDVGSCLWSQTSITYTTRLRPALS